MKTTWSPITTLAIGVAGVLAWLFARNKFPFLSRGNVLTEKDNGANIGIKAGDRLTVTLRSVPSTGFNWYLISGFPDVQPVKGSARQGSMPGTGVIESWTWKIPPSAGQAVPVGIGQQRIRFEYKRGWETAVPPAKTFSVDVTVSP